VKFLGYLFVPIPPFDTTLPLVWWDVFVGTSSGK